MNGYNGLNSKSRHGQCRNGALYHLCNFNVLVFFILGCGSETSAPQESRLDCLGTVEEQCELNSVCTAVRAATECEEEHCTQLYVGCLPVDAMCADRDEVLCALADSCLKLYSRADEFLRCDTEVCESDSDCSLTDGYACFDGFIDGQRRCRQAPIECSTDDECPTGQTCEIVDESTQVCL